MLGFPVDPLMRVVTEVKHSLTFMSRRNDQHMRLVAMNAADASLGCFEMHSLLTHLASVLTTNDCEALVKLAVTEHVLNRVRQKVG